MTKPSKRQIEELLGTTVQELDQELTEFREAAAVLSSSHPRLIDEHPDQWVGVYKGIVEAAATSMPGLMRQLAQKDIPASKAMVRYIARTQRTLIL